ncbi:MAG: cell wall hydrolase [Proteobacteria bacterium]|nr:cell wall hydrolase [Pseudomonadota bacterium]
MIWKSSPPGTEDRDILARTIFGEARGELYGGKVAVAQVIMNRVRAKTWFGNGVVSVCLSPGQFSCWNAGDPNREKIEAATEDDDAFRECLDVAERVLGAEFPDITFGSRHYHTPGATPYWSRGKTPIIQIGGHLFFNNVS